MIRADRKSCMDHRAVLVVLSFSLSISDVSVRMFRFFLFVLGNDTVYESIMRIGLFG